MAVMAVVAVMETAETIPVIAQQSHPLPCSASFPAGVVGEKGFDGP